MSTLTLDTGFVRISVKAEEISHSIGMKVERQNEIIFLALTKGECNRLIEMLRLTAKSIK